MISEIKIPTILGLLVLLAGLSSGIFLVTQNQLFSLKTKAAKPLKVENVTVVNITEKSASIYWQTDQAIPGFVQAGATSSLNLTFRDERDFQEPKPHFLHFVTLDNLTPETTYFYKINSGSNTYPQDNRLTFTTAKTSNRSETDFGQPLIGTVVNEKLQPQAEALISLEIPGNSTLATITKAAGNFILPLANFSSPTSATLTVFDLEKSSKVTLLLPVRVPLPPITLGQDLDLTNFAASPSPQTNGQLIKYDLNKDGVVNSLDLSLVIKNMGPLRQSDSEARKKPKLQEADLNSDGVVDQEDINLINPFIPNIAPKK